MSLMGELKLFLGIQIKQCKGGVYVYHPKYTKENLKKFKMDGYKIMSALMHPTCNLIKEESNIIVDQKLY